MQDRRKAKFYCSRFFKKIRSFKKDFKLSNEKFKPLIQTLVTLRLIWNVYTFIKMKVSG